MKLLFSLAVLLISTTQTYAASGDVAVASDKVPAGGWLIIGIVLVVLLVGVLGATGKKVEERDKEYKERLRKAGRNDIPSD